VFLWFGAYTSGRDSLQTAQDLITGKFSFKESALDKTVRPPSSGRGMSARSGISNLNLTTAVPSVSKPTVSKEEKQLKWSCVAGIESKLACIST